MLPTSRLLILLPLCSTLPLLADEPLFEPLAAVTTRQGIEVREGDRNVLFYQTAMKSQDGKLARANYVHPLYDLDGQVISQDFPKDHLHHRGIFWAWHQVLIGDKQIGDAWVCQRFIWDVRSARAEVQADRVVIRSEVHWKSPDWQPGVKSGKPGESPRNGKKGDSPKTKYPAFLEERVRIVAHRRQPKYRLVDFHITLKPLIPTVAIGGSENAKGYGGFSARIPLPRDLKFEGQVGAVEPITNAVEGGTWMNFSGKLNGKSRGGLAVLCHPNHPTTPQKWILRRRGSMQNPQFPGRHPLRLDPGPPLSLKYRLVLHRGDLKKGQLESLSAAWKQVR